jgi:Predicted phosphoribosyltransferases
MASESMSAIYEETRLRDRIAVFEDREDAGEQLARFIQEGFDFSRPLICPIPAGGIPIGVALARALNAPLRPVVVRKIQIPWSPESGFGAVTWRGDIVFNEDLLARLSLSPEEIESAVTRAKESVRERVRRYPVLDTLREIPGSTIVLTDDGLASGFTMQAAVDSIRRNSPDRIIVAVPTGSLTAVRMISPRVEELICLNIRSGFSFAVADAYRHWHDLTDEEVLTYLHKADPHARKQDLP